MKALVTGGTGFIGSHLVEALLQRGVQVRCLLRSHNLKWLKDLPVEIVTGNCNDRSSLNEAVQGVDWVFHLAGMTRVVREKDYFEVNARGTDNLIHACLEHSGQLQKFIYLSSQAAAGPCLDGRPKRETDVCQPVSPYGESKRKGEELALAHAHELPLVILRPPSVYGPRDRDIYQFFKWVSKKIIPCFSSQKQRVSLCYVGDVVQALWTAATAQTKSGEIFFLSDGIDYNIDEIGDTFAKAMGVRAICICVPKPLILGAAFISEISSSILRKPALLSRARVREMFPDNWTCDITKAKTVLGFQPQIQLAQGARLTYQWYKNQKWL